MWWGVILAALGLGVGFFGLRRASVIDGRTTEHERQKRYADMIHREMAKKDQAIKRRTDQNVKLVRRTTRRRLKKKSAKSAGSFLSRTKERW